LLEAFNKLATLDALERCGFGIQFGYCHRVVEASFRVVTSGSASVLVMDSPARCARYAPQLRGKGAGGPPMTPSIALASERFSRRPSKYEPQRVQRYWLSSSCEPNRDTSSG